MHWIAMSQLVPRAKVHEDTVLGMAFYHLLILVVKHH